MKLLYVVFIIGFLMLLPFLLYGLALSGYEQFEEVVGGVNEFYVGVDVAFDDLDQLNELIDRVDSYCNFFLVGTTGISQNLSKLDSVCSLLTQKGMYFVIYEEEHWRLDLVSVMEQRYGNYCLGLEFEDEWGGMQLDRGDYMWVFSADNYTHASKEYVDHLTTYLNTDYLSIGLVPDDFVLFTADYALYWFDYLAGYDVVLAEFGWNYSRQINIAQVRGAATVLDRDWGVIIAWTYAEPPYLGSGEELFDDLVLAFENGAKYVLVFDTNKDFSASTLREEHFDALERFWQYVDDNPRSVDLLDERVAYVLPKDWAFGFRGPDDKIWGLWDGDELVSLISEDVGVLLNEYGSKLDVIYDDGLKLNDTYSKYYFWNGTKYVP